jgi:hypothetical protein
VSLIRQAIRRGSFDSVPDLVAAIRPFTDVYNTRCKPFVWTKTADDTFPASPVRQLQPSGTSSASP